MTRDTLTVIDNASPAPVHRRGLREAIGQVRTVVMNTALDCACREKVERALTRMEQMEQRKEQKRLLAAAHDQQHKIAALLGLLYDFDTITSVDPDPSLLAEASLLFDDIAAAAADGSAQLRELLNLENGVAPPASGEA
ncbi:hypothetical protein [Ciceribacter azotifigens]|uniref:hypothetical protein n=1 Tax=Ciceribacter azotifigens TaxID=2069303 RepID=UPI003A844462